MARPGLFKHRKFNRLASRLRSAILAVGVLETLWYVCGETCDDRLGTAEDLAYALKWTDRRVNIAAVLHECGFLDAHEDGTYVAHDYWDHCPQYVTRRRQREDERHTTGTQTRKRLSSRASMASHSDIIIKTQSSTPVSVQSSAVQSSACTTADTHEPPVPVGDLWDHWREVAERCGVLEPVMLSPKGYAALRALFDLHTLDSLRSAVTAFWTTPHFHGKRQVGMFAANAGQIVAHVASGATHPYGERQPMTRRAAEDAEAARLAAWAQREDA